MFFQNNVLPLDLYGPQEKIVNICKKKLVFYELILCLQRILLLEQKILHDLENLFAVRS